MKILALIPARGGSKGVPQKNSKLLAGKPLIQYTIDVAKNTNLIDTVVVSSDDDKIINISKQLGAEVPFKRPENLALDSSPTLPVLIHALQYYESLGKKFEAVCLLQPTSPFRTKVFLEKAIKQFIKTETDSLVSVQEVPHEYNPHWTFVTDEKNQLQIATNDKKIITRRQDLPKAFHRDGAIYITKTKVIKEQKSLYGNSIAYIQSPKENYVNIDTLEDWEKAENIASKLEYK